MGGGTYLNHTAAAALLLLCDCRYARFRPAWLMVAVVGTFVLGELADDPEKPCQVKFTWRYATNRMNLQNTKSSDVFTDDFDFVFT